MSPRVYDLSENVVPADGAEAITDTPAAESATGSTDDARSSQDTDPTKLDSNPFNEDSTRKPDDRIDVTNLASRRSVAKRSTPIPKISSEQFSQVLSAIDKVSSANPESDFGESVVAGVRDFSYKANLNSLNVLAAVVPTLIKSGNFDQSDRNALVALSNQVSKLRRQADDPTAGGGGGTTLPAADPSGGGGGAGPSADPTGTSPAPDPTTAPDPSTAPDQTADAPSGGAAPAGGGADPTGGAPMGGSDPSGGVGAPLPAQDPTQQVQSARKLRRLVLTGQVAYNDLSKAARELLARTDEEIANNYYPDPNKKDDDDEVDEDDGFGGKKAPPFGSEDSKESRRRLPSRKAGPNDPPVPAPPAGGPPPAAPGAPPAAPAPPAPPAGADPAAGGGGCGHEYPWASNADGAPLTCTQHDHQTGDHSTQHANDGSPVKWPSDTPDASAVADPNKKTSRTAEDNLGVAKKDTDTDDVEKPVSNDTTDRAQETQYEIGQYNQNGPLLTDPDESVDQNWAPGDGKKDGDKEASIPPKASAVDAIRLTDMYIDLGLITAEQKYQVVAGFEKMNSFIVKDRIKVLAEVQKTANANKPSRDRSMVPQSMNGNPNPVQPGKLPSMGRGSSVNGHKQSDGLEHFLAL